MAEEVLAHIGDLNQFRLNIDGAAGGLEVVGLIATQLGHTVVGFLLTGEAGGNDVAQSVGLAKRAEDEHRAALVLHVHVLVVLLEHGHRVLEHDLGAVGDLVEGGDVGDRRCGAELIDGLGHSTLLAVQHGDGLQGGVGADGHGSAVLAAAGTGLATVGGVVDARAGGAALHLDVDRGVVGARGDAEGGLGDGDLTAAAGGDGHRREAILTSLCQI